jgi:hypothetical protein
MQRDFARQGMEVGDHFVEREKLIYQMQWDKC